MTDKRREHRFVIDVPVKWENANRVIESSTKDISYSGVFIETLAPCAVRDILNITVPVGAETLEIEGEVRWLRLDEDGTSEGMGVYFLRELTPTERSAVKGMLAGSQTETLIA